MRQPTAKEYIHEQLGAEFETALSEYDTRRRVETLIDEFLTDEMVAGREALDAGCGLGFFSQRLHERGAKVTACDLGPRLVERTRQRVGCAAEVADVLQLKAHFGRDRFDLVVSSECIEHTPAPDTAVRQMAEVLKPGGYLALSTPNIVWNPVVRAATALRLRPFTGHENFSSWRGLRRTLKDAGIEIVRERGLHLFPFQFGMDRLSAWCDRRLQLARGAMINICLLGRKRRS
ncbi:MAG: 2-polyprenyl-6-hydroxyphenyl methylase / 3-demethylubiquinone-9 3-methyltransferase [Chthoniobacter sp.]|jgi:2-polyprenyl-3-methyl-5-hydroxy-6-metoxy-1,4-benzoquinol methylase|nr:2-polyprenyl-6-hydroxyphenyl methylase / 3-demethylubiquinone-9 3-methyltransferase [Chthoniobacter sp.]